jgi:hypothetical protein
LFYRDSLSKGGILRVHAETASGPETRVGHSAECRDPIGIIVLSNKVNESTVSIRGRHGDAAKLVTALECCRSVRLTARKRPIRESHRSSLRALPADEV